MRPHGARALCTSPLLRFVSCPPSYPPLPPLNRGITASNVSLSPSFPIFQRLSSLPLLSRSSLPRSVSLQFSIPLLVVRPWEQLRSSSPTTPPPGPLGPPPRERCSCALRSLASRPRRVYIPHSPYLHLHAPPLYVHARLGHGVRADAHARGDQRRTSLLSRKIKANPVNVTRGTASRDDRGVGGPEVFAATGITGGLVAGPRPRRDKGADSSGDGTRGRFRCSS